MPFPAPVPSPVQGSRCASGRTVSARWARGSPYRGRVDDGVRAALAASSFASLPAPATQRLLTRARLVRIPAGSVTHREGETAEHLELVVEGLVRAFVTAPDGRTLTVRYCRRGALIGAVSMYATGFRMPAGIQAVVDAAVLRMSPGVVRRAAAQDPRVADALLRELADRALGLRPRDHRERVHDHPPAGRPPSAGPRGSGGRG